MPPNLQDADTAWLVDELRDRGYVAVTRKMYDRRMDERDRAVKLAGDALLYLRSRDIARAVQTLRKIHVPL